MMWCGQVDYSLPLLIREIPDYYAIYDSASCHCDQTVHIAELVMSQKMAAFVLASMVRVCWGRGGGGGLSLSIC